jgi:predicted metal-binding membrane protein
VHTLARDRTTLVALAGATVLAWIGLDRLGEPMGVGAFLLGWTLMMTAMMLPSIAPLVLLYRGSRTQLAVGYLAVWALVGFGTWLLMDNGVMPPIPLVLALAGVYELTPLKTACLRRCRTPADFLLTHYRSSALRLGLEHAVWCIGCCIGLMVVLVLAAAMGLGWAAVIAAIVFVQKVLPLGDRTARLTALGLFAAAIVVALT